MHVSHIFRQGNSEEYLDNVVDNDFFPLSTGSLMEQAILGFRGLISGELAAIYLSNDLLTGDLVVGHPDGRSKILLDGVYLYWRGLRRYLRERNGEKELLIPEELYERLEGPEFNRNEVDEINISDEELKEHPVLQALSRNKDRLAQYISLRRRGMDDFCRYIDRPGRVGASIDLAVSCSSQQGVEVRVFYLPGIRKDTEAGQFILSSCSDFSWALEEMIMVAKSFFNGLYRVKVRGVF